MHDQPPVADEARSHLVLDGRDTRCEMRLEHGSLVLHRQGHSPRRHPLRRTGRITVSGDVLLHADALAALARTGAPLGVLDGEGRLTAILMPCNRRRGSLSDELDKLPRRRDWRDRLEDWRRSEVSLHARALRLPDPAQAARLGWSGAEAILIRAATLLSRAQHHHLSINARSFAQLLVQQILADGGCPPSWRGADPDPAHNITDIFAQIALWRLARLAATPRGTRALRKALHGDASRPPALFRAALATTAENAARVLRRPLVEDLRRFHRHLLDLNASTAWLPTYGRKP